MIITRENIIKYWFSEPVRDYREGYLNFNQIPFPDLQTLTIEERNALRPILARHPEYLTEIFCIRRSVN